MAVSVGAGRRDNHPFPEKNHNQPDNRTVFIECFLTEAENNALTLIARKEGISTDEAIGQSVMEFVKSVNPGGKK
ncbi:MAG: hypothetical protein ACR2N3_10255 [Pyrinomonadaceae bacterium]